MGANLERCIPMTLHDAHIHLFDPGFSNRYGPLGDELRLYAEIRTIHNIGSALVVGYEGQSVFASNNRLILELSRHHRWIKPLCFHSCREKPSTNWWQQVATAGSLGLVLYPATEEDIEGLRSWPTGFWQEISDSRAIVSVNVPARFAASMAQFCSLAPKATWLFSHLGLPGPFDSVPTAAMVNERISGVLALAEQPNAGVKISGFYAVSSPQANFPHPEAAPVVAALHKAFGTERLYWGSDFSPALGYVSMEQTILAAERLFNDPAERDLIMGENLQRLLEGMTR